MLTDNNIEFIHNGTNGIPLVWIIDGQCLYDLPLSVEIAQIFTDYDQIEDVSSEYLEHEGITVAFYKNGQKIEEFQTTEYFGSILLSNPLVLNLLEYPGGVNVMSPNATFDGERFTQYEV